MKIIRVGHQYLFVDKCIFFFIRINFRELENVTKLNVHLGFALALIRQPGVFGVGDCACCTASSLVDTFLPLSFPSILDLPATHVYLVLPMMYWEVISYYAAV